jgi:hypothetical protein
MKMNLKEELNGFTGTEAYHKLTLGPTLATDGVKHLAERGNCFWLIDVIASYQDKFKDVPFQVWEIVRTGNSAVITMKEDSDKPDLVTQEIEFTDLPLDELTLYVIHGVLLLPSEY